MPKNSSTPAENNSQAKLRNETLGDFTTTRRVIPISALATVIGLLCAFVALALLRLIGLFTILFYFGRWSTALVSPAGNHLGIFNVLVPVVGALIIGAMARYGSERIRGHGIPEAKALTEGATEQQLSEILKADEFPHGHLDHSLAMVLDRMGASQLAVLPVVNRANVHKLEGVVTLQDVLRLYGLEPIETSVASGESPATPPQH